MSETDQPKNIQSVKLEGTFTGYVASGKAQSAPDSQNAVATADGSPLKDPVDLRDFNINWEYTLNITLILIGVIAGAMALNYLLKHTILAAFDKFTSGKKNVFIKVIVKQQLVNRALAMIPPIIVYIILPTLFNAQTHGVALEWAQRLCFIYMTLVGVRLVNTAIGSLHDIIYVRAPMGHKPLKGFVQVVQLLDVEIAEAEGLFQFHAVLPAQPGDHGGGDDKMVFQVQHRVTGKLSHAFPLPEAAQLAVVAHGVHIAIGHRPVELVFFAGIPVLHLIHFIVGFQKQPFLLVTHLTPAFCGAERCRPGGTAEIFWLHYTTNRRFPATARGLFPCQKAAFWIKSGHGFDIFCSILIYPGALSTL